MLDPTEAQALTEQFGVSPGQIARDHLISHLLAALSTHAAEEVIFFGGTALARSLLPEGRLSEDIDLIAQGSRRDVAAHLHLTLPRALRREYPDLRWEPALTQVREAEPAVLHSPQGLTVRIQLLSPIGYPLWPVHRVNLTQRYSDAPAARLTVPTAPAFAASKTTAWYHRAAARDLYDLWALGTHNHLSTEAAELFARHGPTNRPPTSEVNSAWPSPPPKRSPRCVSTGQPRHSPSPAQREQCPSADPTIGPRREKGFAKCACCARRPPPARRRPNRVG